MRKLFVVLFVVIGLMAFIAPAFASEGLDISGGSHGEHYCPPGWHWDEGKGRCECDKPQPTSTPVPSETPNPTPDPTKTQEPTPEETPEETPEVTSTPRPEDPEKEPFRPSWPACDAKIEDVHEDFMDDYLYRCGTPAPDPCPWIEGIMADDADCVETTAVPYDENDGIEITYNWSCLEAWTDFSGIELEAAFVNGEMVQYTEENGRATVQVAEGINTVRFVFDGYVLDFEASGEICETFTAFAAPAPLNWDLGIYSGADPGIAIEFPAGMWSEDVFIRSDGEFLTVPSEYYRSGNTYIGWWEYAGLEEDATIEVCVNLNSNIHCHEVTNAGNDLSIGNDGGAWQFTEDGDIRLFPGDTWNSIRSQVDPTMTHEDFRAKWLDIYGSFQEGVVYDMSLWNS